MPRGAIDANKRMNLRLRAEQKATLMPAGARDDCRRLQATGQKDFFKRFVRAGGLRIPQANRQSGLSGRSINQKAGSEKKTGLPCAA